MRRSEQREHIFKLLFMTQFNSENEMSDQVSMYFDTLGELEEKDQEAIQNKYQHILEHLDEIDQILNEYSQTDLLDPDPHFIICTDHNTGRSILNKRGYSIYQSAWHSQDRKSVV